MTGPIPDETLNAHKAAMFDALRDLFLELVALASVARRALEADKRLYSDKR